MRNGSNTNDHNGSNHNVMARRASAYIPKWSKSSRANKSTASKKLTAIGLFLVLTVLLCVTLIMVRGLDGNIDNSLSSSEAHIQSNKGNQMNEDREENLSDSLQMENVNEHETSNIVSGDSVHMKRYSLDHFYNQLDYSMDGNEVSMSNFVGNVLVLVNVASE